jgi:radical SAM superfamily enzyme YgiQ (UPF0313 family)
VKVTLIDSPTSHEQIYGDWDLSGVDTYCPPLGLLSIASYIRQFGHSPEVIDIAARKWSLNQAVDYVCLTEPDLIGISAKTINVYNANKLAEQLKHKGLKAPIVIGGAHVTAVTVETMRKFDAMDYGVIGEGEITFYELIKKIANNNPVDDVEGIVVRNSNGQPMVNPRRAPIHNLDDLPLPAWDLLPEFPEGYHHSELETKRLPAASIMTSRGCPFKCTFCDHKIFGSMTRHHSAEYSLKMIRHLKNEYGIKDLMILDDNFILNKKKLFQICDTMIKDKMDLSWYCMGHANFMTEDRLKKIKEAGCWFIEIGIESGCDRILQLLKKNTTKKEIAAAVRRAKDAGLKIKGNFIFGLPTETKDSLEETIEFAINIELSYFQQNFLTIWPGCELADSPGQFGKFENDWSKLAHQRITFIPHGLKEKDLIHASKTAFRRFYLRPKIIFGILSSLTSIRAIKSIIISFVVFLKTISR